jgi:3-oxo-5-alpha-steroid 4-dehydrogenase 3 / polyprenol reductase
VPHNWFKHFYILSMLSSMFWAHQLWSRGLAYKLVSDYISEKRVPYVKIETVVYLWICMFLQGTRRLYESFAYAKPSQSTMWLGHWLMGLGFYFFVNIAIWIEAVGSFIEFLCDIEMLTRMTATLRAYDVTEDSTHLYLMPFFRIISLIHVVDCLRRQMEQNRLHCYLFTLPGAPNYQIPSRLGFSTAVCPHYGAEVSVYANLCLITLAVKDGEVFFNSTLLLALVFVYTNLSVTAFGTQKWYRNRFGERAVQGKLLLLPENRGWISWLDPINVKQLLSYVFR